MTAAGIEAKAPMTDPSSTARTRSSRPIASSIATSTDRREVAEMLTVGYEDIESLMNAAIPIPEVPGRARPMRRPPVTACRRPRPSKRSAGCAMRTSAGRATSEWDTTAPSRRR